MFKEMKEMSLWFIFGIGLIAIAIIVFSIMGYMGRYTKTVVERKVFEQSYQKQSADKNREKNYRAQLAKINVMLNDPNISEDRKNNLLAQKAMIEVQLNSY